MTREEYRLLAAFCDNAPGPRDPALIADLVKRGYLDRLKVSEYLPGIEGYAVQLSRLGYQAIRAYEGKEIPCLP